MSHKLLSPLPFFMVLSPLQIITNIGRNETYWPNQKIKIMFRCLANSHLTQRGRARNFSKSQSLYRERKARNFSESQSRGVPSYFPHISSHFPHNLFHNILQIIHHISQIYLHILHISTYYTGVGNSEIFKSHSPKLKAHTYYLHISSYSFIFPTYFFIIYTYILTFPTYFFKAKKKKVVIFPSPIDGRGRRAIRGFQLYSWVKIFVRGAP